jgi:hypothetical protein
MLLVNNSLVSLDLNVFSLSRAGLKAITMALQKNWSLERLVLLNDNGYSDLVLSMDTTTGGGKVAFSQVRRWKHSNSLVQIEEEICPSNGTNTCKIP